MVLTVLATLVTVTVIGLALMICVPFARKFAALQRTEQALHEADFGSIEKAKERIDYLYGAYSRVSVKADRLQRALHETQERAAKAERESQERLEALVGTEEQLRKFESGYDDAKPAEAEEVG